MTWDEVRAIVLAWPGTEDGTSYGRTGLKLRGKFLAGLWEDGRTMVCPVGGLDEQEALIESEPEVYFLTDHYRGWPYVLVRLPVARPEHVAGLLDGAWLRRAGKRLIAAREAGRAA